MEQIPEETLARARRKMARQIASLIVRVMAETDTSFSVMADRIGVSEKTVCGWVGRLMDGDGTGMMLDRISDIFLTMNVELALRATYRQETVTFTPAGHGPPTREPAPAE